MTRAALLLLLALSACLEPCEYPAALVHYGTPAAGADEVIARAAAICPSRILGTITWTEAPFDCVGVLAAGCLDSVGPCGIDARVLRREPATASALAHEIGHYCTGSPKEADADDFAARVGP